MARVLIVDDDDGIRETVRTLLEDEGYEVAEAEDGQQALDYLRANPDPLVVLLDYRMPRMSGGEMLRHAANEGLEPRHAYILMLATPSLVEHDPYLREHAAALGIPVIAKPFEIETLLRTVACRVDRLAAQQAGV